ncbi:MULTISPECIES: Sec-independent protein translocase protein TatAo [Haloferax]|uniref:Sec-independent protein translocase protein TatAo n=1 Tax=Haloferax sp. Atlit-48N TaxID=2077198 RepID=A0ACD5HYP9_9EURY|nr:MULTISPECIES: Sec-independent protein translocase protein TatAo [Haloferax]RDZ32823.1 twin-arginine translocase TatA/TatE family subunit [Haloferax sp. Atlit-48N]RDZ37491.1 twin-arginine translocase TatA/TatE family subunit [Haloferax sp. Atlit-24N]RLM38287.1 twin-arginine translocase TatA/TatE family subunit [Haloferax sp. Atlit-109R]RLM46230.1 twin-arginine translocase TatA/TatE family subunit [Haloferax sp. Atlit-105R]WEL29118.1 Sec-independent protein secretion pathway component [Halofe
MLDSIPLFPGLPGGPELLIVLLIVVLLFGANKLPQLARSSGQAMGEFRRGREEIEEELKKGAEGGDDEDEKGDEAEADDADATETEAESR